MRTACGRIRRFTKKLIALRDCRPVCGKRLARGARRRWVRRHLTAPRAWTAVYVRDRCVVTGVGCRPPSFASAAHRHLTFEVVVGGQATLRGLARCSARTGIEPSLGVGPRLRQERARAFPAGRIPGHLQEPLGGGSARDGAAGHPRCPGCPGEHGRPQCRRTRRQAPGNRRSYGRQGRTDRCRARQARKLCTFWGVPSAAVR
jgi:hypothetical protein